MSGRRYLFAVYAAPGSMLEQSSAQHDSSEETIRAVSRFNDKLVRADRFVFACGLTDPSTAVTVDGTESGGEHGLVSPGPIPKADVNISGMWIIRANDDDEAMELAVEASHACGQRVEVRLLQDAD